MIILTFAVVIGAILVLFPGVVNFFLCVYVFVKQLASWKTGCLRLWLVIVNKNFEYLSLDNLNLEMCFDNVSKATWCKKQGSKLVHGFFRIREQYLSYVLIKCKNKYIDFASIVYVLRSLLDMLEDIIMTSLQSWFWSLSLPVCSQDQGHRLLEYRAHLHEQKSNYQLSDVSDQHESETIESIQDIDFM